VEAGKTKEAAKRLMVSTGRKLTEGSDLENAFETLWQVYGSEEPKSEGKPAYDAQNYPL